MVMTQKKKKKHSNTPRFMTIRNHCTSKTTTHEVVGTSEAFKTTYYFLQKTSFFRCFGGSTRGF